MIYRAKGQRTISVDPGRRVLYRLYTVEEQPVSQIARDLDCARYTIYRWLHRYGISTERQPYGNHYDK